MSAVRLVSMSCLADTLAAAESVVAGLMGAGFAADRISILFAESGVARDRFEAKHTGLSAGTDPGAAAHWLGGARHLIIGGNGAFVATGPIGTSLGADALGITERGVAEALIRLGLTEARAHQCERLVVGTGCVLIAAHDDEPEPSDQITRIASNAGAHAVEGLSALPMGGSKSISDGHPAHETT